MANEVILTAPMRLMVPIIKVVGDFCNLRCTYCFYHTRDQQTYHVMKKDLLERFLAQYMDLFGGNLMFIWHGGEPLLAGRNFFENVVVTQARLHRSHHSSVVNLIQTNATLVDEQWARFFKEHEFRVGVSLDGDAESHDRFRKKYDGQGSFEEVRRGIEILRHHGLEPGIIQTLTHETIPRVREDFRFFTDILGAKGWGTNHYLDLQKMNERMSEQTITPQELTEYLKALIDLWLEEDNPA